MSILSDITIRELCKSPRTIEECREQASFAQYLLKVRNRHEKKRVEQCPPHLAKLYPITPFKELTDDELEEQAQLIFHSSRPMIEPFLPELVRTVEHRDIHGGDLVVEDRKIISKGTTSYGYDVSLTEDVKIFTNIGATEIDPKRFDHQHCLAQAEVRTDVDGGRYVVIPPHSYMLGSTVEYFRIPRDVMVICVGKSTYARSGAIVNTTPIEPGFEGNVVIEIANTAPLPCRIYLDEGIAQFLFFRGDHPCRVSYGDRGGKYQFQTGVTPPKV